MGHGDQYQVVTALFFQFAQVPTGPPYHRMPPEQGSHDQYQQSNPVVLAANVGQFVGEDRLLGPGIQPLEKRNRQKHPGPAAKRPDQRGHADGEHGNLGNPPETQPLADPLSHAEHGGRSRFGGTKHLLKAEDTVGVPGCEQDDSCTPNPYQNGQPRCHGDLGK